MVQILGTGEVQIGTIDLQVFLFFICLYNSLALLSSTLLYHIALLYYISSILSTHSTHTPTWIELASF